MNEKNEPDMAQDDLLRMAARIVAAYVQNNAVSTTDVPDVIQSVYASLRNAQTSKGRGASEDLKPAVSIRKSITPEYIVCLEDGRKLKMLKRHLRTTYGLTPEEYRAKWSLPPDYPMVAPNYARQRSEFAKKIGLGHKRSGAARRKGRRAKK